MVKVEEIKRGDIFLVNLDPTRGSEIRKVRPCVVVSPDELNTHLRTFIVAPMKTGDHPYPFRVTCRFQRKVGYIVLDQIRTVDHDRLIRSLGRLPSAVLNNVLTILQEMFSP